MLFIKFLSGPLAGKTLPLKPGKNVIGRAPHCDVVIPSNNISKEHATIEIYNDKVIVTDLNSRNGTFINGIQIKSQKLAAGEKLGFFDIFVEIRTKKNSDQNQRSANNLHALPNRQAPSTHGNLAYDQNPQQHPQSYSTPQPQMPEGNLKSYIVRYFEDVVLPGAYKLIEWFEFRYVLGLFVAFFIVFVTALSTVPLMRILKSSIEKEAQNRAQTIARALVRENKAAIMQGQTTLVSTDVAQREPGVNKAYVISSYDGDILAPPGEAGQHLIDVPFVHEARKSNQEMVSQVDDSTIVAVAPIKFYKSDTGTDTVAAHAVIVYNMGALAVDNGRTLSLFVQVLFIAIILGGLLYLFLYKIILRPILDVNAQVDATLRTGHGQIAVVYRFPELQSLVTNINSAISRSAGGFAGSQLQNFELDRSLEMQHLVNLVGFPALTINADKVITGANHHFLSHIGAQGQWSNMPLQNITDQSLKLNLQNLVDAISANPSQMATDQLEIAGQNYELSAQAIMGSKAMAYVIVVFVPKSGDHS